MSKWVGGGSFCTLHTDGSSLEGNVKSMGKRDDSEPAILGVRSEGETSL